MIKLNKKVSKIASLILIAIVVIGLLGPFIVKEGGVIPYDSETIDLQAMNFQSPSIVNQHYLGTDSVGRDILAGCIYGIRNALSFGLVAVSFALIIGLLLGVVSAYFQNSGLKLKRSILVSVFIGISCQIITLSASIPFEVKLVSFHDYVVSMFMSTSISFLIATLTYLVLRIFSKQKFVRVNIDLWTNRFMESLESFPALFILISALALVDANFLLTAIIVGGLSWVSIARICRAEIMKIKESSFIESAKALGLSHTTIIKNHILPNIYQPIIIQAIFIFSNCILIESTLNFIGIGTSITEISWGSMLAEAGQNLRAWWLLLFPGLFVFATIYCLRILVIDLGKTTQDTPL